MVPQELATTPEQREKHIPAHKQAVPAAFNQATQRLLNTQFATLGDLSRHERKFNTALKRALRVASASRAIELRQLATDYETHLGNFVVQTQRKRS